MAEERGRRAPIRQSVHVECPIEEAFRLFTEEFGEWWPLASYSITGEDATGCEMEPWAGGRVFERTRSGEEREWGTIQLWGPPSRLEFTWHADGRADSGQRVEVQFHADAIGTMVTLTHYGWDNTAVQAEAVGTGYAARWKIVLELWFAAYASKHVLVGA